jgi:hypothetical protein
MSQAQVTINAEQRLFVIPCGGGFSCLGFDVAEKRRVAYLAWLKHPVAPVEVGTLESYHAYQGALAMVKARFDATGERCPCELTPALIGLEKMRVEVTTPDGEKTRFYVGKSTGFIPCHLEIKTRRSTGGAAAYVPEGATVRVIGKR